MISFQLPTFSKLDFWKRVVNQMSLPQWTGIPASQLVDLFAVYCTASWPARYRSLIVLKFVDLCVGRKLESGKIIEFERLKSNPGIRVRESRFIWKIGTITNECLKNLTEFIEPTRIAEWGFEFFICGCGRYKSNVIFLHATQSYSRVFQSFWLFQIRTKKFLLFLDLSHLF